MKRLTVFGVAGLQPCVKTVPSWPDLCPNNGSRQPRAAKSAEPGRTGRVTSSVIALRGGNRVGMTRPADLVRDQFELANRGEYVAAGKMFSEDVGRRMQACLRGAVSCRRTQQNRSVHPRTRARSVAAQDDHPPGKAQRPELEEVAVRTGVLLPLLGVLPRLGAGLAEATPARAPVTWRQRQHGLAI